MQMRTREEIDRQITALKRLKERLPEYNMFGDDNHRIIDVQINILEGVEIAGDYETDEDQIFMSATDAEDWLDGVTNDDLADDEDYN